MKKVSRKVGEIVYGPVRSRRLGSSLGIGVVGQEGKTCSFDCVYCQYGQTVHHVACPEMVSDPLSPETILVAVEQALLPLKGEHLDSITFSGNGEPTLHPQINTIVQGVLEIRDKYCPTTPVDMLTNASLVLDPSVRRALEALDRIVAKLDVGDQELFCSVNRPADGVPPIVDIVGGLGELNREARGRLVLQTLIFESTDPCRVDNWRAQAVEQLAERIYQIDPAKVQLYTIARAPSERHVAGVEAQVLESIKGKIDRKLGRDVATVYC